MSILYKMETTIDYSILEFIGEMCIENIDEIKSVLSEFHNSSSKLILRNDKIDKVDLSFLQLLVSLKKQVETEGRKLIVRSDFSSDVMNTINLSGFQSLIRLEDK